MANEVFKRCDDAPREQYRCAHTWHMAHEWTNTHTGLYERHRYAIDVLIRHVDLEAMNIRLDDPAHVADKTTAQKIADYVVGQIIAGKFVTPKAQRAAKRRAEENPKAALVEGIDPSAMTLREMLKIYSAAYLEAKKVKGKQNASIIKRLTAHLGDRLFLSLTTLDYELYLAGLAEPEIINREKTARVRSIGSQNKARTRIGHFERWCVHRGLLERSRFYSAHGELLIHELKGEGKRERIIPIEEEVAILAHGDDVLRDWWIVAVNTGMRFGEQFEQMTCGRVNLLTREITLEYGETKNKKGRKIPLSPEAYEVLSRHVRYSNGRMRPRDELVFLHGDGTPIRDWEPRARLLTAAAKAGSHDITWHDARHEFGRRLYYLCGVPLQVIQKLYGHATFEQTAYYLNVSTEGIANGVASLGGWIAEARKQAEAEYRKQQETATLGTIATQSPREGDAAEQAA